MYKLLLCLRYLRTRYIALASIVSVMLGVATMIVVNSVMAGFSMEMRDRIHGFLADVIIESRDMNGIVDSQAQIQKVREAVGDDIVAVAATVEVPGMINYEDPITGKTFTHPVQILAIDPATKASVGPLKDNLVSYQPVMENGEVRQPALRDPDEPVSFNLTPEAQEYRELKTLNDAMLLQERGLGMQGMDIGANDEGLPPEFDEVLTGDQPPSSFEEPLFQNEPEEARDPAAPLAARVFIGEQITSYRVKDPETGEMRWIRMVQPGDDVIITTVGSGTPPEPVHFSATVTDLFRSGMSEYDSSLVLMNIEQLQENRGMIVNGVDAITSIQIKLKDYSDAESVVRRLRAKFPPGAVVVSTWEDKQGLLLSAVEMETAILNVLLFMIIAVAGFGILAIFFMIVVEKTRDIGILKSLGAGSNGVMSIFLSYGLGLGMVGSAAGVGIGLLFVRYINEIEDMLSWVTGREVFDQQIYYFPTIPTIVNPMMVFWVALGAITIAVLASVLPARRASRLHPVRALRFE